MTIEQSLVAVLLSGSVLGAQPTVDLDRRVQDDASGGTYYLVFVARPPGLTGDPSSGRSLTGHAYVSWLAEDPRRRMTIAESKGLYCASSDGDTCALSLFKTMPGELRREVIGSAAVDGTIRLVVQVNERQYDAARAVEAKWGAKGSYRLLASDCVSFVAAVARTIGLDTPPRLSQLLPIEFLQRLIEVNR